jgi:hypothetical protein
VLGSREPVHQQSVSQQIDVLSTHADAVGSAEEERVLEVAVDGLRVVASRVEDATSTWRLRGPGRALLGNGSAKSRSWEYPNTLSRRLANRSGHR